MSIKALVCGGIQIGGISASARTLYDGVYVEMRGTRLEDGKHVPAGLSIEMSPTNALDLAHQLIAAAEDHGTQTRRQVATMIKRLAKAQEKRALKGKP